MPGRSSSFRLHVVEHHGQGFVIVHEQAFLTVATALPVRPRERPSAGVEALELALRVAAQPRVEDAAAVLDAGESEEGVGR